MCIRDSNGTVLLTPEEIREALDSGTLDEESIDPTCLTGENGLLQCCLLYTSRCV